MLIIGLTGTIASGKSTVAAMLKKSGIPVIDADAISHEITKKGSPALAEIARVFGADMVTCDGELDRQKLGRAVFSDKNLLKKLEAILHPKIEAQRNYLIETLSKQGHKIVVYMAPLLFEKNIHKSLTKTLLITADSNLIKKRIQKRDHLSDHEIENRINAQLSDQDKIKMADEVLKNNGSLEDLYKNLAQSWVKLTGQKLPDAA